MFKKVLVVLDGTKQDEAVIPYVRELARKTEAEVVLLRAVLASASSGLAPGEAQLAAVTVAEDYLSKLQQRLRHDGLRTRFVVPYGAMPEAVLESATLQAVNAIVIAGPNGEGAGAWAAQGIQKMVTRAGVPIVVLPTGHSDQNSLNSSSQIRRCANCRFIVRQSSYSIEDNCPRCGYALRSCFNCAFHDGIICQMDDPQSEDRFAGTDCEDFQFRESSSADRRSSLPAGRC